MGSAGEAASAAKTGRRKRIGTSRKGKKRAAAAKAVDGALFLSAFDVQDVSEPRFEMEFGPDGPLDAAFTPQIKLAFQEAWSKLSLDSAEVSGCIALEGYARGRGRGFSLPQMSEIRTGLKRALTELLVDDAERTEPIRPAGIDAELRVYHGWADFVDNHSRLWKSGAADSSSGMWNQLLVPSSRSEGESDMSRSLSRADEPGEPATDWHTVQRRIERLDEAVTIAQRPLQQELQALLDDLAGCSFGSLADNTAAANALRFLMLRLEVRVECPREGCHEASLIRCRPAGRTRHGSFEFEHRRNGRLSTHAASTKLPALKLVPAPPHARRKQAK